MTPPGTVRGMLDAAELSERIGAGTVDTVLVAFPDLQGRLVGKRVTGSYWREHMGGGTTPLHMCNYLLAVDSEMNVLPGYEFASWDQGYGDMAAQPDLATIRLVPWLEKTALVLCDLLDEETGAPVEVSPRRILQRQVERAAAAGFTLNFASELEFFVFRESLEEAAAKDFANLTPHSLVVEDYHILQTTRDEYLIRAIRNGIDGAGVPVEFSKGEAGRGQHEINLVYANAVEMADRHVIYKNGVKEIAAQHGRAVTFMAKFSSDEVGSSCHVHSSLWSADGRDALMWDATAPDHLSPAMRGWLGGQIACGRELAWMYAPTVNSYKRYQPESWAPTALGVEHRQPHLRLPDRRARIVVPPRVPHSGRRRQPLPRVRGDDRGRAARHRARHRSRSALQGQRVRRPRPRPRAGEPRGGDRGVRGLEGRGRRVRRRRARPPAEHRPPGMGPLQPRRHRLGAAPELRPMVSARW